MDATSELKKRILAEGQNLGRGILLGLAKLHQFLASYLVIVAPLAPLRDDHRGHVCTVLHPPRYSAASAEFGIIRMGHDE